jgi:hypothetical protein
MSNLRTRIVVVSTRHRSTAKALARDGHLVEIATSATEAIARLRHLQFDLAIVEDILGGDSANPVTDELDRKSIPYIVWRSPSDQTSAFPNARVQLQQSSSLALLQAVVRSLTNGAGRSRHD